MVLTRLLPMPNLTKLLLIAVLLAGATGTMVSTSNAQDPDLVGVLAIAVQPNVASQLGLTEKQLADLNALIGWKEQELLGLSREWKILTVPERNAKKRPSEATWRRRDSPCLARSRLPFCGRCRPLLPPNP